MVGDALGSAVVAAANDLGSAVPDGTGPRTTSAGTTAAREVRKPRGLVGAFGAFA